MLRKLMEYTQSPQWIEKVMEFTDMAKVNVLIKEYCISSFVLLDFILKVGNMTL